MQDITKPKPTRPRRTFLLFVLSALVMLLLVSPWLLRAYRLWTVPDVVLPFDEAVISTVVVAPDDNALELYQQASKFLKRDTSKEFSDQWQAAMDAESWDKVPAVVRDWLERNQPAFDLFMEGSKKPDFLHTQPKDFTLDTKLEQSQDLREFTRLARFAALRRQSAGNLKGAWECHRAALRASRQVCRHGSIVERLMGVAMHAMAADALVLWSRDPRIDAALLRSARDEVREIYRMTPRPSVNLDVEYFGMSHAIDNPRGYAEDSSPPHRRRSKKKYAAWVYFIGEPEYSQRILRHVLSNWVSQIDLPLRERTKRFGTYDLYELPANASGARSLTPQQLQLATDRSLLAKIVLPPTRLFEMATDREQVREDLLELDLSAQLFAREHQGQLPEKLEELVPQYVSKLPIDLWGPPVPLKYRREPRTLKATFWSVGPDGSDDGGTKEWLDSPYSQTAPGSGDWILPFPKAS